MSLLDKLQKNSTSSFTSTVDESSFFNSDVEDVPTHIPILNIAFSGSIHHGLHPGLTILAGPSKHFKSNLALACVAAYLEKYPDAVCLFYDSEFGAPLTYMNAFGIDTSRVLHTPVEDIEQLKFDMVQQLEGIDYNDHVIVFVDSIGNLPSKKESEDAKNQNSAADMTRAKELKSWGRLTTNKLNMRNIPCLAVNHTYDDMSNPYGGQIVSGGSGPYLSADNVWVIGRAQEKEGKDVVGYQFKIRIDKSRQVAEKSTFPFTVTFEHGIHKWSGLFELAWDLGYIQQPKLGWYSRIFPDREDEKKWRKKETNSSDFWMPLIEETSFLGDVYKKYSLESTSMVDDATEMENLINDKED